jgi:hypothetical protein
MKHLTRKSAGIIAVLIAFGLLQTPSAWAFTPWYVSGSSGPIWHQPNYYVYYRWGGNISSGTTYYEGFRQALADWNNAQGQRKFVRGGSTALGALDTYNVADGTYGTTNLSGNTSTGSIKAWASKINRWYSKTHTFTGARNTGGHELGHALGLHHTNNYAIMNARETGIKVPQLDDIKGINYIY